MSRRAPFATALALACALGGALQAQAAPASRESVETTLKLMKTEQNLTGIWAPAEANMRQSIAKAHGAVPATPQQQAVEERAIQRAMAVMHEQMTWEKMKPAYVDLYVATFSQEEIDGLNAFYSSPAGQAYLAKMPLMIPRMMQLMQTQLQELMPKLQAIIRDSRDDPGLAPQ
jgi:hypothetical protein